MQGSMRANATVNPKACARPGRSPDRQGPKGRSANFEHRQPAPSAAAPNRGAGARDRRLPAHPGNRSFSCQGNRR